MRVGGFNRALRRLRTYPAPLRDLLIHLARTGLFRARSSHTVSPLYVYDTASQAYQGLDTDAQSWNTWDGAWVRANQDGLKLAINPPVSTR